MEMTFTDGMMKICLSRPMLSHSGEYIFISQVMKTDHRSRYSRRRKGISFFFQTFRNSVASVIAFKGPWVSKLFLFFLQYHLS